MFSELGTNAHGQNVSALRMCENVPIYRCIGMWHKERGCTVLKVCGFTVIWYGVYIIFYTSTRYSTLLPDILFFFSSFFLNPVYGVFLILFIQYYSVICRTSDHTVGRPRAEIRTRAGRPRGRDTTPRPPHLLPRPPHLLN